jgi:hypothetical protein
VREQVDGAAAGAGEQVRDRVHLIDFRLGEEAVRRRLDELVGVADGDDRAGEHAHLDRLRCAVLVEIGRLIGDVEIDVDHFAGDRRAGGEQRDLLGLAGTAIDDRTASEPAHEPDRARFDVAQEGRHDHGQHDQHEQNDAGDQNQV